MSVVRSAVAAAAALFALGPLAASAQNQAIPDPDSVYVVDPVVVTATRGPRVLSNSPAPMSVMQRRDLMEQMPNTISDLFRTLPGLDVTGVGISQVRPQIRGQGGQRVLLLTDGIRVNNTRRERNFGELPALVDLGAVEQVEVVRGPASVLYGSDAIGGVINVITESPVRDGSRGSASYLFGSAGDQSKASVRFEGRGGAFSFQGGGTWRRAGTYEAAAGDFGDITLADDVEVLHSGVEDRTFDTRFGWDVTESISVFAKAEQYSADDSGFGFVHPDQYNPGDVEIEILYPQQRFTKLSGGLRVRALTNPLAQEVSLTIYGQDNERDLTFDMFIPFPAPPGAGIMLANDNFTDIRTYGFRAEARTLLANELQLTYGLDGFQDNSEGRDYSTQVMVGFGPPRNLSPPSNAPSIPHAKFRSLGAFLQGELEVAERLTLAAGGRYQDVSAATRATPYLSNLPPDDSNSALVGAVNAMYEVVDGVQLIGSVGRGFRSPNLIELFFNGVTPEGDAYQRASQNLEPETSLNYDLGARYQDDLLYVEGFYFWNKISDGIRPEAVTDTNGAIVQTAGFDTYQNINVDKIRLEGLELNADVRLANGIGFGASFATLDAEDAVNPLNPVGESYSTKVTGRAGYRDPAGRFWGEWETRYSGKQKDAAIAPTNVLCGTLAPGVPCELPSFMVHGIRGGVRLIETGRLTHGLTLAVSNLTDELYAETANASFFRPEPKLNLAISWDVTF